MTIITKSLSGEKKGDKLEVPLVDNDQLATATPGEDVEAGSHVVIMRAKVRRVSTSTTLCLLLTSLMVVSIGIIGGKYLYDQYISAQMRRFRCPVEIPIRTQDISSSDTALFKALPQGDDDDEQFTYFHQDVEIGVDDDNYEKIDVPDFQDGRSGRFIHDFNTNITGIIDITGNRCFVMPLNRGNVLPPRSLFDLIRKISGGYYKVDTQIVRETMKVVTPPLDDLKDVGTYIAKECENRPVYKLEKYVGGVVKRSADLHEEAKFAQYSGNKITEFDIVNLEDVKPFESGSFVSLD